MQKICTLCYVHMVCFSHRGQCCEERLTRVWLSTKIHSEKQAGRCVRASNYVGRAVDESVIHDSPPKIGKYFDRSDQLIPSPSFQLLGCYKGTGRNRPDEAMRGENRTADHKGPIDVNISIYIGVLEILEDH